MTKQPTLTGRLSTTIGSRGPGGSRQTLRGLPPTVEMMKYSPVSRVQVDDIGKTRQRVLVDRWGDNSSPFYTPGKDVTTANNVHNITDYRSYISTFQDPLIEHSSSMYILLVSITH